jgi:hypothetical protein
MARIVPIERERHGHKGWKRPEGFNFAKALSVAPLSGSEFPLAIPAMPIAFALHAGSYTPVALVGLAKGTNLFVGPGGQWLGGYVPGVLRAHPFSLIGGRGETDFAVDEDSGLIVDNVAGEGVERFYEGDGTLSPATQKTKELLTALEGDQALTARAMAALAEAKIIVPWNLTVQMGTRQVTVEGLHCVDGQALKALDDATFLKLRKDSALVLAYGQLMSMLQVNVLARLGGVRERLAMVATTGEQPKLM